MPETTPEIGKSLQIKDILINYHDRGAGDPIVLIHGSGPGVTAWANWRLVIPELEATHRVVAPDMAGFGYTVTAADLAMTPEVWVRQIVELMDGLGIEKAVLIGNSFGGAIALAAAARHPERVGGLVLMGAVGTTSAVASAGSYFSDGAGGAIASPALGAEALEQAAKAPGATIPTANAVKARRRVIDGSGSAGLTWIQGA